MKTKLSKKLLSAFLAVMMVVTSIPMFAVTSYAADSAITEIENAMKAFEAKLQSQGSFTNVKQAYDAYVACQQALDAYTYGSETDALNGKAAALTSAIANIGTFTAKTGTVVPTFDDSTTAEMSEYAGVAYQNILYAPAAEAITSTSSAVGNAFHKVYYSPNITVLYDGVNDILIPVLVSAYMEGTKNGYDKTRYIWSAYPSSENSTSGADNADWNLVGQWNGGEGKTADWDWNWNQGLYQGTNMHAGWNQANGAQGVYSTSLRSRRIWQATRSGSFISYKYSISSELYMANVLKFVGKAPTTPGAQYQPYWVVTTGGDNNNDGSVTQAGVPIRVVNYKLLLDAIETNGSKMKNTAVSDFTEGGLSDYMTAMDAATTFDPNTYFANNTNGYDACLTAMNTCVSNINNASTTNYDSNEYQALRDAMSDAVRTVYAGGNVGYTSDSWLAFATAYLNAQATMAAVNDGMGYTQAATAGTRAEALVTAYANLTTNVAKQDTSALVNLITTINSYQDIFTDASYAAVETAINNAKIAVWGAVENYNVPTEGPDEGEAAANRINNQINLINNAVKGLRIDPDASVVTSAGRYSLNEALALEEAAGRSSQYANWGDFQTVLNNAKSYKNALNTTEFTDYTAQLNDYVYQIEAVVDAYHNLQISFTEIPNGTIASANGQVEIATLNRKDQGEENIGFAYTNGATIIMTKHEAKTVTFGKADITFGTSIESKENNMLDSISINATAPKLGDNGAKLSINSKGSTSTPTALSDSEKATYAGCLSVNGISIKNIRWVSKTNNCNPVQLITLSDGTKITDPIQASQTDLTDILGTTDGASANPARGGVFARSTGNMSYVYMTSDMTVDVPAPTNQTLTESTVPTMSTISHTGNFGAVLTWNCQNTLNYAGYSYMTTEQNSEQIGININVVDASPLFDLIDQCNLIEGDSYKYTEASWNNFATALKAAKTNMNYASLSATNITNQCKTRYNNLWAAYKALELKTFNIAFNYNTAEGVVTTATIPVVYGQKIDVATFNSTVKPVAYKSNDGVKTFTPNGLWTPTLDLNAAVVADATYTALYDESINAADFTAFNTAKAELKGVLTDDTYTVADLQTLSTEIEAISYFDDASHDGVMADMQTAIDAQTAKLIELKASLTASELDLSTAQAAQADAKVKGGDVDRYDLSGLDFDFKKNVTVADETVVGLVFGTQAEIDAAIADVLNNIQVKTYTIYVNNNPVVTAEFGTPVVINSDGKTYQLNATDTNANYDGDKVAWTYSYDAPSRGKAGRTADKYMVTAPSFGFIVKGDTYLTATKTDNAPENTYLVTVKSEQTGKTIDVQRTTGEYTMPTAPNYANWTFSKYDNGADQGAKITVTADTVILANYTPNTKFTYQIDVANSFDDLFEGKFDSGSYNFNDRIDLANEDAYCWVIADMDLVNEKDYFTLLAYGTEYSFYACQSYVMTDTDMDTLTGKCIVPLTYDEYISIVEDSTDYEKPLGAQDYVVFYNEEAMDTILDGNGNPIIAESVTVSGRKVTFYHREFVATVSSLANAVPVGDNAEKFSLIGTFTLPEGSEIVECGFLFTSNDNPGDMIVDRVGVNGIARMKASRYTCGNQFVINIKNPSSTVTFNYAPYAIVKDADGNVSTVYGAVQNGSNNF